MAIAAGAGQATLVNSIFPFSDIYVSQYTVNLNEDSLSGTLKQGESTAVYLDYYQDGRSLSRHELMPFQICNLLGIGKVEESGQLKNELQGMGSFMGTEAGTMDSGDQFVQIAMNLVAGDSYTTGNDSIFSIQLVPTIDPTKFLGFIEVNVGNMSDKDQVTGVYANGDNSGQSDLDYLPSVGALMMLTGLKSPMNYAMDQMNDYNKVLKRKGVRSTSFDLGGYAESLIFYDFTSRSWKIQILRGGFNAGFGMSYNWDWNTMVGPIPFTASLTVGGTAEVSMDALTVGYQNASQPNRIYTGNDFLTELRIYLYLKFFAGVGFDFSIIAFKLGIYGQINLDMRFQWLNRPYLTPGMENVADGGTDPTLDGQSFKIDGQIGLLFVMRFLFLSFEQILFSFSFDLLDAKTGDWNHIQSNWEANQKALQDTIGELVKTGALSTYNVGGQQMLALNLAPTLESREYLEDKHLRQWGESGISTFALDPESALANLESNTYPYANPVVSDDGTLVVYLSDMASMDVEETRAVFATKNGGSYAKGGVMAEGGSGDSQIALSGTKDFAVSAWTRQTVSLNKDQGAVATDADQSMMLAGTEVCAAVYDGEKWIATELTKNSSPDVAPVVATNGKSGDEGKAVVAWRAVATSGQKVETAGGVEMAAMTTFDERDTIVYRTYENGVWGEETTLYNGTSGAVKGITAAMLEDGTAAIAYTLDGDGDDKTGTDKEVQYAVIGPEGQVTRTIRATNDSYLDENPQLAAVSFPSEATQRFVLGWYTEQAVASDSAAMLNAGGTPSGGESISDIRLLDFGADGIVGQLLPDSISQVADSYGVSITSNFSFAKHAKSINDLSILWVERAEGLMKDLGTADQGSTDKEYNTDLSKLGVERDVLKGVKFYTYGPDGEQIRFTGAVDVAEMDGGTLINHFDTYVSDPSTNEIKAVILGTTYGAEGEAGTKNRVVTLADGKTQAEVTVPTERSAMYTATETYQDRIEVPAVLADYENIHKGATTQVQFTVDNKGIHAIRQVTIQVGDAETVYGTDGSLNLLPGDSIQLYADYTVPADRVIDPTYTVTAAFDESTGASGGAVTQRMGLMGRGIEELNQASGIIYLDLPDLGITKATITREEEGERDIQVVLNNSYDAALKDSGCTVRLGFYTDATCEQPFDKAVLPPVLITEQIELAAIDEGGYSKQVTFDVGAYLKGEDTAAKEIPEDGVTVYIKAEILDENDTVQAEWRNSNNSESVTCENLQVRTGLPVSTSSDLTMKGEMAEVVVTLQNNRLTQSSTGNVIVTLLDEESTVLAQQQTYTGQEGNNGLIELAGEAIWERTISFDGIKSTGGIIVRITYSDQILGTDNANLANLSFSNIPGINLEDFTLEDGIYCAAVSTDDLTKTAVLAEAESPLSQVGVSVGGQMETRSADTAGNILGEEVSLTPGKENVIVVYVTAQDGSKQTYQLTVQNNGEPVIDPIAPEEDSQYSASTVYLGADIKVQLTAVEQGIYQLTYQWYQCDDALGANPQPIEGATAATLAIPSSKDAGIYYYRCKLTRPLLDQGTKEYWSTVATVQIRQAEGNAVSAEDVEADYDGKPHGLALVTAKEEGSSVLYSTDGTNWSEEAPTFIAAGAHTVYLKAIHNNYEDTEVITASVTITMPETVQYQPIKQTLADVFAQYPKTITDKYGDADSLTAALKRVLVDAQQAPEENVQVYDLKLQISLDNGTSWVDATADNFPPQGIDILLPYPEGTSRAAHNFSLYHLVTDPLKTGKEVGTIEEMDITLEEGGIRTHVDCLSPFVLGWKNRPSAIIGAGGTGDLVEMIYRVNMESAAHGTVKSSVTQARAGGSVTLTATPDSGYRLGELSVKTTAGRKVATEQMADGTYRFTMPGRSVVVTARFVSQSSTQTPSQNPFSDVDADSYYHDAVRWAVENGVTNGTGDTIFTPEMICTRAQAVTFLWRAMGSPAPDSTANPFTDVDRGTYYYDAVLWAAGSGVTQGTGASTFRPHDTVTRSQTVTFLWRAVGMPKADSGIAFADVDQAAYYAEAVRWAVSEGITVGTGAGMFSPVDACTRAQIVTFLYRCMEQ